MNNVLSNRRGEDGALLPILHDIQADFGWVPDEVVPLVATALNLSRADVHGVLLDGAKAFADDVRNGTFPGPEHTF